MQKLFLLDAMALIYRAHFAFAKNPRINSKKVNTGAVLGFTNSLLEILQKENPSHIGVAFDTPEPTFRHIQFEAYKAQRQQQPEDISIAIPYIFDILRAFNIPILRVPGFEADDVIGTLAKKAEAQSDCTIYMMTPDKDYAQLVTDRILLYKPAMFGNDVAIWGVKEVLEKWDIDNTLQVIDILGLQGDAVDNIPGIPGIGEKTAIKLIKEYGSIENLIAKNSELKGKLQENIVNFSAQGLLSKQLATIELNTPIELDMQTLARQPMNEQAVKDLFDDLEFKTLKARVFKETLENKVLVPNPNNHTQNTSKTKLSPKKQNIAQVDMFGNNTSTIIETKENKEENENITPSFSNYYKNITDTIHQYYLIDTPELRKELIEYLSQQTEFCFDTETTNIDALEAELVGMSFSYYATEAYYIPFPADKIQTLSILNELKPILENEKIQKIGQNIKYDLCVLENYGIKLKGKMWDTMLAHYILEPDARHNLDTLSQNYLQYSPVSIETLIGKKGNTQGNMREVALQTIKEYASEDADLTWQLKQKFAPELEKYQKLQHVFETIEMPLMPVLAKIERNGVKIDTEILKVISESLAKDILILEQKIYTQAGVTFNIASPKQLGDVLFEKLKLDEKAKKTKTGQYATGEEILTKLKDKHLIINLILEYREWVKLKNTYVDALPLLVSKTDGRVHTSYQQAVASTGRLSSTNPNLQNIPIKTEKGREIRKAFVAQDENFVLLSADYSQIELRIMAHFAKDQTMIEAFKNQADIHRITASKIFKVEENEVTDDMRRKAKTANFGIIYGISAHGLSERLSIPRKEASEIINAYFEEFPSIKAYMDNVVNEARATEFVETLSGRRRYLRNLNSGNMLERANADRNAINSPIQGTAADMIKLAMIKIDDFLEENKLVTKMILQVHDELVFEVPLSELDFVKENITQLMKTALLIDVPMEVGVGVGKNWLEAH
ncbi:MAG: DNA polymerase I [Bacteroidetes bacterium]|nr:MAG: DNA polymerase I [Bacteroidota bacterium]TAG86965.1 MAG: DNA polymerase I [Bacteroidota bacterium]